MSSANITDELRIYRDFTSRIPPTTPKEAIEPQAIATNAAIANDSEIEMKKDAPMRMTGHAKIAPDRST